LKKQKAQDMNIENKTENERIQEKLLCHKAGTATSSLMKKYYHQNFNVLFG